MRIGLTKYLFEAIVFMKEEYLHKGVIVTAPKRLSAEEDWTIDGSLVKRNQQC